MTCSSRATRARGAIEEGRWTRDESGGHRLTIHLVGSTEDGEAHLQTLVVGDRECRGLTHHDDGFGAEFAPAVSMSQAP